MITDSFDIATETYINEEDFYGKQGKMVDTCIIIFSDQIYQKILTTYACKKISEISGCNGSTDIMSLVYKGKEIAFYLTELGSTMCAQCMIEAAWVSGAYRFIMSGSCGSISEKTKGKYIIPTESYRDEGMSYHFKKPSDYIAIKNHEKVASFFKENHIPYIEGRVWTTDAFTRETRGAVQKRREEGCLAVEMEIAGVEAVADFYGFELYTFLECGDTFAEEYNNTGLNEANHNHSKFEIELEFALTLKNEVCLFQPHIEDLWYRKQLVEDEKTMSFNEAYGGPFPFDRKKWEPFYQKWGLDENYFYRYIFDENHSYAGEIGYVKETDTTCWMHMIVEYSKRNQGIGTKALQLLLDEAKKNGMEEIKVEMDENDKNIAVFIKQGFIKARSTVFAKKL